MKYVIFNEEGILRGVSAAPQGDNFLEENPQVSFDGCTLVEYKKKCMLYDVIAKHQAIIYNLTAEYAPYEVESFIDQRNEWRAWKADATAATPIVDVLASARGISKEALMAKIEANVLAIVKLQGSQNAIEDSIKACTTIEELEALEV